jgi:hypothetical protein
MCTGRSWISRSKLGISLERYHISLRYIASRYIHLGTVGIVGSLTNLNARALCMHYHCLNYEVLCDICPRR